jgi:hypothetical protein
VPLEQLWSVGGTPLDSAPPELKYQRAG